MLVDPHTTAVVTTAKGVALMGSAIGSLFGPLGSVVGAKVGYVAGACLAASQMRRH
ncbi:hypothetical protein [Pseudanabaena sp. SR411]|uniref:hypothetical protein n=1 Tax=Pseudanabaena sp. SR411 TaxID=1980935 RepID=UPI001595BCBC|nr:hypothetical protein [Pseudanabaena sp. SR411]